MIMQQEQIDLRTKFSNNSDLWEAVRNFITYDYPQRKNALYVLEGYLGLERCDHPKSISEMARDLNLSTSRVQQVNQQVLRRVSLFLNHFYNNGDNGHPRKALFLSMEVKLRLIFPDRSLDEITSEDLFKLLDRVNADPRNIFEMSPDRVTSKRYRTLWTLFIAHAECVCQGVSRKLTRFIDQWPEEEWRNIKTISKHNRSLIKAAQLLIGKLQKADQEQFSPEVRYTLTGLRDYLNNVSLEDH